MRIVVSIQREDGDDRLAPPTIQKTINRLARRCVELQAEHRHMEWMTQTSQLKGRKDAKPDE